tara:strand:- start:16718 stop:17140 length:423 start_codon:yes stop_codon:yes gene_type:complete
MPKRMLTIRDWSGGMNNRKDPRDIAQNESSGIVNMSIDALGKIKTAGGLYAHSKDTDGSATLPQYIVERAASIAGAGGYGLFYFEADQGRDATYTITDTKHPGSSNALVLGTGVGNINFVANAGFGSEDDDDVPPAIGGG